MVHHKAILVIETLCEYQGKIVSNRTKRGEKLPISNNTTLTSDRSIDICFQKEELYSLGG